MFAARRVQAIVGSPLGRARMFVLVRRLSGDLIWCVLGEETLGVCANEGVSCDGTV